MLDKETQEARDVFNTMRNEVGVAFDAESANKLSYGLLSDNDFEVDIDGGTYRFIESYAIDSIQEEELANDEYILGCFNASFLASVTDIDFDVITALQEAEAFEGLGKLLRDNYISAIQQGYCSADGYGHHFSHYDHSEYEIAVDGVIKWYVFRTN